MTALPATDATIQAYDSAPEGELIGVMATHNDPAYNQYVNLTVPQLPSYQVQKFIPTVDNNDNALNGALEDAFRRVTGMVLPNQMDLAPYAIGPGTDCMVLGVMIRYGKRVPAQNGRTIRLYTTKTGIAANTWTDHTALTGLDPAKFYGLRGMQCIPAAAKFTIGSRLQLPEYGAKFGVTVGQEIDLVKEFGEYACIFSGKDQLMVQSATNESSGATEVILVLDELGGQPYSMTGTMSSGASGRNPLVGDLRSALTNFVR